MGGAGGNPIHRFRVSRFINNVFVGYKFVAINYACKYVAYLQVYVYICRVTKFTVVFLFH